jgi:hypothetical protein
MSKLRSWLHQKTWTKVGYDYSARKVVSHTGAANIHSGSIYGYRIQAQGHLDVAGCIGDRWSGYRWMRIGYDTVDWYVLGIYATRRRTLSSYRSI